MFQSQHGRPDISFMSVTPRLGQPASPNFSIYILFPTQGTEMLQQSRASPGLLCCAVDMLGNEGRAIPIICAVNRTEEKKYVPGQSWGDYADVSPGPHLN